MSERLDLSALQDIQEAFDKKHWAHEPGPLTIQHVFTHLVDLCGKMSKYVGEFQHGETPSAEFLEILINEVTPDLASHSARLANYALKDIRLDLGELKEARDQSLAERFTQS